MVCSVILYSKVSSKDYISERVILGSRFIASSHNKEQIIKNKINLLQTSFQVGMEQNQAADENTQENYLAYGATADTAGVG